MVAMVHYIVTMATIQMVYKFVQSDAHIIPIVKNNSGRLYVSPRVYSQVYYPVRYCN